MTEVTHPPLLTLLSERAALLAALLERHPGWHLLAEYESELHERPVLAEALMQEPGMVGYGRGLLSRMEDVILELEEQLLPASSAA